MLFGRMISVVGVHAEGEPNDVIIGGVLDVPGRTMFDKARHLETEGDALRQFLLHEPRGKVTQCINLILPATDPTAVAGYVIMESASYPPMSGSNTICTATALLATGMVPMTEPMTEFTLEAPGGLIRIQADCRGGSCNSITLRNVPSFVLALDQKVEVGGIGTVTVDIAYGGMMYAIADARALGFALEPAEARDLVAMGERIKAAAAAQCPAVHPEDARIHTVNQTLFAGPLERGEDGLTARNTVVVSPGRLDRSPCGTGTSARLAVMHARGQIEVGERFVHRSIIGSAFTGVIETTLSVGGLDAVVPSITGRAWITGFHQYVLDPTDPFPTGYRLSDTWPTEGQYG